MYHMPIHRALPALDPAPSVRSARRAHFRLGVAAAPAIGFPWGVRVGPGDVALKRLLLAAGADVYRKNGDDHSVLQEAEREADPRILALVEGGEAVRARRRGCMSPSRRPAVG